MQTIAKNIRERMTNRKVSAHALEKNAGLKNSAVQNILYGRSKNPSIKILSAIARALECDVSELIDSTPATSTSVDSPASAPVPSKDSSPWKPELYFLSFEAVKDQVRNAKVTLAKKQHFLNIVDEVYQYSESQNLSHPDEHFTSWIIDRGLYD